MQKPDFDLLPTPRFLELKGGVFSFPEDGLIVLDGPEPAKLLFTAQILQRALRGAGVKWEIAAGKAAPLAQTRAALMVVPGALPHPQGYTLTVTEAGIRIVAETPAGIFYAVQTLRQMIAGVGRELPTLLCRDWPDYPNRGVMLDISRDKVPSMETLYGLVNLFVGWKINQLQLYTEHTFAYRNHPVVWEKASPLTGEEILALDAYCQERFIELVPNQNTFGHMGRWLTQDEYRRLAECPDGCDTRWGRFDEPFSLCPTDEGSLDLVRSMLDELLPHFSSQQVNVGGDEPVDLDMAQGRSGEAIGELGIGRVYWDFMRKIYTEVKARRHTMQFWGDIIMEHPELAPELPRDAIALEWGYEADHNFDEHGALFAASGIPFYVCPGTSSWRTVGGRTDNALENLRNAAINGLKHGAVGYLNTDWGDNGHWQPLPVSYLGFLYGAALAWGVDANLDLDVPRSLDVHVFRDASEVMGKLAYDLGNVHRLTGIFPPNSTSLFNVLQMDPETAMDYLGKFTPEDMETILPDLARRFEATEARIDEVMAPLAKAEMDRWDAAVMSQEFTWAAAMLRHACRRAVWMIQRMRGEDTREGAQRLAEEADALMEGFEVVWHLRNRPGGFSDSLARMQTMRRDYTV